MFETPVTSDPIVANYLSNLPVYRMGISPLLRGVEIGLAHGFFLPGPFIKLGPLRQHIRLNRARVSSSVLFFVIIYMGFKEFSFFCSIV